MSIEEVLRTCPPDHWKTEQAIAFDWYDGPRQGIAAMVIPECEFVFELIGERFNPAGLDDRLFRLRELPIGSVQSILEVIPQLGEPSKPVWIPVWKFADEREKQEADRVIDEILAGAKETGVVALSQDMEHFGGAWVVREKEMDQSDWFDFLEIP